MQRKDLQLLQFRTRMIKQALVAYQQYLWVIQVRGDEVLLHIGFDKYSKTCLKTLEATQK